MNIIEITSFEDFHRHVITYDGETAVYRGVKHEEYDLKPKVGRVTFLAGKNKYVEKRKTR